jgi:hypothetical protein
MTQQAKQRIIADVLILIAGVLILAAIAVIG